jgi:hypothetical protein
MLALGSRQWLALDEHHHHRDRERLGGRSGRRHSIRRCGRAVSARGVLARGVG